MKLVNAAMAFLSLSAATAQAESTGAPLSACYDHVAIACSATSSQPQACIVTGMSACESALEQSQSNLTTLARIDFEDPMSQQPMIIFVHVPPAAAQVTHVATAPLPTATETRLDG